MPYGEIDLGRHVSGNGLLLEQVQAIIWKNVDLSLKVF